VPEASVTRVDFVFRNVIWCKGGWMMQIGISSENNENNMMVQILLRAICGIFIIVIHIRSTMKRRGTKVRDFLRTSKDLCNV
jgi:hypothetical protein